MLPFLRDRYKPEPVPVLYFLDWKRMRREREERRRRETVEREILEEAERRKQREASKPAIKIEVW